MQIVITENGVKIYISKSLITNILKLKICSWITLVLCSRIEVVCHLIFLIVREFAPVKLDFLRNFIFECFVSFSLIFVRMNDMLTLLQVMSLRIREFWWNTSTRRKLKKLERRCWSKLWTVFSYWSVKYCTMFHNIAFPFLGIKRTQDVRKLKKQDYVVKSAFVIRKRNCCSRIVMKIRQRKNHRDIIETFCVHLFEKNIFIKRNSDCLLSCLLFEAIFNFHSMWFVISHTELI